MIAEKKIPVLVVDDDAATGHLLESLIDKDKFEPTIADSGEKARELLSSSKFPLILCDIDLGSMSGLDLIPLTKQNQNGSLIVFVTGHGSIDTAVRSIKEGAFDYLCKSFDLSEMQTNIRRVLLRAAKHLALLPVSGCEIRPESQYAPKTLVGASSKIVEVYRAIAKAALFNGNVLIAGESGTGKELVAQAIHNASARSQQPFVPVNCGALTETLLESELFGHIKGSFTGAIQNKRGLFEEAEGGTIFLDEIGDISLASQVKLLRAIQEGEIKPVGGNITKKVNVRVIAASHRNLPEYVRDGRFREDLYFRLKVFQVEIPPLRDRKEDIPILVQQFVSQSSSRIGKKVTSVSVEAMQVLMDYQWPGNVRELENVIARAVAVTSSPMLFPEDLTDEIRSLANDSRNKTEPKMDGSTKSNGSETQTLEDLEKDHILKTLLKHGFNRTRAAEALGIDRVTLYRKMARYQISVP